MLNHNTGNNLQKEILHHKEVSEQFKIMNLKVETLMHFYHTKNNVPTTELAVEISHLFNRFLEVLVSKDGDTYGHSEKIG